MPFFGSLGILITRVLVVVGAILSEITTFTGNGLAGFSNTISFAGAISTAVDSVGNVYVADTNNNRIRKIDTSGIVSTLAGSGTAGFADGTGTSAQFSGPMAIAADPSGIVYVADTNNHRIRKITSAGVVTTLAGSGTSGNTNGSGTNATFSSPMGIAVDRFGQTIYISSGNIIRKMTSGGVVTTLAGQTTAGTSDFLGTQASFGGPRGIAVDYWSTVYVADTQNQTIRKIDTSGLVTTLAGSMQSGGSQDGTGSNGRFILPSGVAIDAIGGQDVYVADRNNHRIRKISSTGVVTTLAGSTSGSLDGDGTNAQFREPQGVAVDSAGTVYVADSLNHLIRKITSEGLVTTLAGGGQSGFSDTSTVSLVGLFNTPIGLTIDPIGRVYVADSNNHRIRRITRSGIVSTFAGTGTVGSLNAAMLTSTFNTPKGVVVDSAGNVYVADSANRMIRRITSAGVVTTFAGSATSGFADGTGTSATFNTPFGITVDRLGTVYVSDIGNHNIRRITSAGVVTTLAGSRTATFADGAGTNASFNTPQGIVADIYGNVYVADTNNHRIRRITSDGTVMTFTGSTAGYLDGIGTNAQFNFPTYLSINALGTLYVADQTNNRIRTIQTSTGVVSTLAGDGTAGFTSSRFSSPQGITFDRFQNAYVADSGNHSIRRIPNTFTLPQNNGVAYWLSTSAYNNADGIAVDLMGNVYSTKYQANQIYKHTSTGVGAVFAGSTFQNAGNADGTGTNARFTFPRAVAVDLDGSVYVADYYNQLIRRISPGGVVTKFAGAWNSYSGGTKGSTNGFGGSFNDPMGVAVDSAGNVYVADYTNHLIRKVSPMRVLSTLAGNITAAGATVDGVGTNARFRYPHTIAVDSAGVAYVLEESVNLIRRISLAGVVTTLAGQTTAGYLDGTGTNALFNNPRKIAVNSAGTNVYVSDDNNGRLRKIITSTGVVSTLAQSTGPLAVDLEETVYVLNGGVLKIGTIITPLPLNQAIVTTFAGNGTTAFTDGTGTSATFNGPGSVTFDSAGNLYIGDVANQRIRKITPAGVVTTLAGSTPGGFSDATGTTAKFSNPYGVAVDSAGNVYVADYNNNRIRKITSLGVVSTLAGQTTAGYLDGTGTSARFNGPWGIAVDSFGTVYVGDYNNQRIRKITAEGIVTTLAGNGTASSVNGTGTNATFNYPTGLTIDSELTVYVTEGNRIRKITPGGVTSTLAGSGTATFADGTGSNASFSNNWGVAVDPAGAVYVADRNNHRIRRITPAGVVSTLAGNGTTTFANGTGTSATFNLPQGLAVDSGGIVYVADSSNHRIRKVQ